MKRIIIKNKISLFVSILLGMTCITALAFVVMLVVHTCEEYGLHGINREISVTISDGGTAAGASSSAGTGISGEEKTSVEDSKPPVGAAPESSASQSGASSLSSSGSTLPANRSSVYSSSSASNSSRSSSSSSSPQSSVSTPIVSQPPASALEYGYDQNMSYELFALINEQRVAAGLPVLTWNADLESTAMIRAKEAAVSFSHTRPDGSSWSTVSPFCRGEILAVGYSTPQQTLDAWMSSAGHRSYILSPGYTVTGIGFCTAVGGDGGYYYYWCEHFA